MLSRPEPTCLVIADIAGYTSYLAGVELDHAQDILADLMSTVVATLRPTLKLAKLEGDAAFAYVVTETIDGSLLQDTVERTYFAFRRRLRDIGQASTCDCDACTRMPQLDLKVVVHHGAVIRQRIANREELVGADVIVVHRLLKNTIDEHLGIKAYALYTDAALTAMGADPRAQGLLEHVETTDVAGQVRGWVRDLEAAWRDEQDRKRVEVGPADAYRIYRTEIDAPPALVWEYVTSPIRRPVWGHGIIEIREDVPGGRRRAGTTNHCIHGKDAIVEEILDWQPVEYWTTRATLPQPGLPKLTMTDRIFPRPDGGSTLEVRIAKPKRSDAAAFAAMFPQLESMFDAVGGDLAAAIADATAEAGTEPDAAVAEPEVPASAGRHLEAAAAR